jgi:hypothetical protein
MQYTLLTIITDHVLKQLAAEIAYSCFRLARGKFPQSLRVATCIQKLDDIRHGFP